MAGAGARCLKYERRGAHNIPLLSGPHPRWYIVRMERKKPLWFNGYSQFCTEWWGFQKGNTTHRIWLGRLWAWIQSRWRPWCHSDHIARVGRGCACCARCRFRRSCWNSCWTDDSHGSALKSLWDSSSKSEIRGKYWK